MSTTRKFGDYIAEARDSDNPLRGERWMVKLPNGWRASVVKDDATLGRWEVAFLDEEGLLHTKMSPTRHDAEEEIAEAITQFVSVISEVDSLADKLGDVLDAGEGPASELKRTLTAAAFLTLAIAYEQGNVDQFTNGVIALRKTANTPEFFMGVVELVTAILKICASANWLLDKGIKPEDLTPEEQERVYPEHAAEIDASALQLARTFLEAEMDKVRRLGGE